MQLFNSFASLIYKTIINNFINKLKSIIMFKKLLTLTIILLGTLGMNAQTISGTVTSLNGVAIANHSVTIMNTDSMNPYYSTTTTSATGTYSFANLPSSSYGYVVSVYDCQNSYQSVYVSSNSGTANFSICTSNPSSCAAIFIANPDSFNTSIINFTDLSTGNPTSWTWDFGDGTTSALQNPSHTYTTNGTYNVTLNIASTLCGDSTSQSIIIGTVTPPSCAAGFYYVPDSSNQSIVDFFDISTGNPTSWAWSFGDGTTSSIQNPSHTYATNGTYNVTLTISSANCGDSITQVIVIGTATNCQAAFTSYPDSSNANTINFSDQSTGTISSWNWSFGDGSTSTSQYPSHTYAAAGTYSVTLLVYGIQNCQSTITQSVTIGSTPTNYSITGAVMAGNNIVNNVIISLFDIVTNNYITSTISNPTGTYTFSNVATGSYKILATPDSSSTTGQNYAPTYYGDMLFWSTASVVIVNSNQTLGAINLIALPVIPGGSGSISGNVGTGTKAASDDVIVNLLDNNLSLVATTKTDANGDYSFNNLAYETYKIWVEIAGKVTTPITITLDANNSTSSDNDFIETNGTVTPKATSIENTISNSDINLYPNPVQNTLNIDINITNTGVYTFNIFSITGQMISAEQINISSGSNLIKLNTNNLNSGSYILVISNDNNTSIQKLFTK